MALEKSAAEAKAETSSAEADLQARRVSDLEGEMAILRADFESEMAARGSLQAELDREKTEGARKSKELREAISLSADQNTLLESLAGRLAAAERGVETAKVGAVEIFKDSQEFADVVAECSADSYRLGFADCKEAAIKAHPGVDFSNLHPPGGEESSEEEAPEEEEPEEEEDERRVAGFVEAVLAGEGGDTDEPAATAPTEAEAEERPPLLRPKPKRGLPAALCNFDFFSFPFVL